MFATTLNAKISPLSSRWGNLSVQIGLKSKIGPTGVYTKYMTEDRFCFECQDAAQIAPASRLGSRGKTPSAPSPLPSNC